MNNNQTTREQLIKRRSEIDNQLNSVNKKEEIELERDMEDQAIQIEQQEVFVTMEKNLQTELAEIEEKLASIDENE